MSDRIVEVAAFSNPVEAHAAHGLLEAEGVRAFLVGEGSANAFSGVPGVGGKITLHVAESDAERAVGILACVVENRDDEEGRPSDDARVWLCPLCGDAVSDTFAVCPACETSRPEGLPSTAVMAAMEPAPASQDIQEAPTTAPGGITSDTPIEAVPSALADDPDIPDAETFLGDDLVRRAFLASLFGFSGFLSLYSLWLLGRLAFFPGKISPRMMPRLYWTMAIDAFWVLLLLLLVYCEVLPR